MDYPTKFFTCDLCGQRHTDADGSCDCLADRFYCSACQSYYPSDAPTYPRRELLGDGTTMIRVVCADCARCADCEAATGTVLDEHGSWLCAECALCEACQDAPGTVLEECGIGTYWLICVQCANREE